MTLNTLIEALINNKIDNIFCEPTNPQECEHKYSKYKGKTDIISTNKDKLQRAEDVYICIECGKSLIDFKSEENICYIPIIYEKINRWEVK